MNQFIESLLSNLGSALILAAVVALLMVGGVWLYDRKRGSKANWKRLILWMLLAGYLSVLVYATLLRGGGDFGHVNLRLFMAWREAWNHFSVRNWGNVLLNIALFIPLGVLVPPIFPKCRGARMIFVVIGTTLLIECAQLFVGFSVFDVDDLFTNTLGGLMGWCLLMAVLSAKGRKWFAGIGYFLLAMIPVAAVGGIFAAYALQPYGNLPENYNYRLDTKNVEWVLDCDLPRHQERAAIYQAPSMSQSECDAFAADFWDGEYDDILYYDEDIYYRDYDADGRIFYLTVSKRDGSYDLWTEHHSFDHEDMVWADLSRTEMDAVLAQYGVTIPAEAEFLGVVEDDPGCHIYQAKTILTEEGLLDGECRIWLDEDGGYLNMYNKLVLFTYCADGAILTPAAAYQRMQDGYFNGWWFENREPKQVNIESCTLGYALDTKGFYQPVYHFEVTTPGWEHSATVMIPAIA